MEKRIRAVEEALHRNDVKALAELVGNVTVKGYIPVLKVLDTVSISITAYVSPKGELYAFATCLTDTGAAHAEAWLKPTVIVINLGSSSIVGRYERDDLPHAEANACYGPSTDVDEKSFDGSVWYLVSGTVTLNPGEYAIVAGSRVEALAWCFWLPTPDSYDYPVAYGRADFMGIAGEDYYVLVPRIVVDIG